MGEPVKVLHAIMKHSQPEMPPLHSLSSAGPAPFVILPSKIAQFMLFMAESYKYGYPSTCHHFWSQPVPHAWVSLINITFYSSNPSNKHYDGVFDSNHHCHFFSHDP